MPSTVTDRLQGLTTSVAVKAPVLCASTGNLTLSSTQVIDGVTASTGVRVLVKNQTASTENGIYEVRSSTWQRTADCDGALDLVVGSLVFVSTGSTANTNYERFWRFGSTSSTSTTITPGTDNITISAASLRASLTGLTVSSFAETLLDDSSAADMRTTLGVPGSTVATTFTGAQLGVRSTLDSSGVEPNLDIDRRSSTPAADDELGSLNFYGRNSADALRRYLSLRARLLDPTASTEDSEGYFQTYVAGTLAERFRIAAGAYMSTASGGDQGRGSFNAASLYLEGAPLNDGYRIMPVHGNVSLSAPTTGSTSLATNQISLSWIHGGSLLVKSSSDGLWGFVDSTAQGSISAFTSNTYLNGSSGQDLVANRFYHVGVKRFSTSSVINFSSGAITKTADTFVDVLSTDEYTSIVGMVYTLNNDFTFAALSGRSVVSNLFPTANKFGFHTEQISVTTCSTSFVKLSSDLDCHLVTNSGHMFMAQAVGYASHTVAGAECRIRIRAVNASSSVSSSGSESVMTSVNSSARQPLHSILLQPLSANYYRFEVMGLVSHNTGIGTFTLRNSVLALSA